MLDTSARLLRLLTLFQSRRDWTGAELADRLGITPRTVRRDVDRLRDLGYPVHAQPGAAGGYRLGAGTALPPLLLDDDEAVAVALGLAAAGSGAVTGLEEASVRALVKLEQVLPARLRHRVGTLQETTVALPGGGPTVDRGTLTLLAAACHGTEQVRFEYRNRDGEASERTVEPHRLVHTGRRWYVMARDVTPGRTPGPQEQDPQEQDRQEQDREEHDRQGEEGWRTFRVDRMSGLRGTGRRFRPVDPPDPAAFVGRGITTAPYRWQMRLLVHAPVEAVRAQVPGTVGTVERLDGGASVLVSGADSLAGLALHVGMIVAALQVEAEVLEPPELREHLVDLGLRMARAGRSGTYSPAGDPASAP